MNFYVFFLNAEERVYGRYGGREPDKAEKWLSLKGLRYAMEQSLQTHRRDPASKPAPRPAMIRVEDYPAAKKLRPGTCIHCHQVNEFRRWKEQAEGTWKREDLWVYPQPQNVGLTVDVHQGDRLIKVYPDSPASRAGLQPGDVLDTVHGLPISSFGDLTYALHKSPAKGKIKVTWLRKGQLQSGDLELPMGWRKTNLTWRPSLLDILPSLGLFGDDLSGEEKKALGLGPNRLAFRQDKTIPAEGKEAGVLPGDVIIGIDNLPMEMTMEDFLAHVRRNFLVGDKISLNVLRAGKRLDLPLKLR